jgi:hypothetical protein
MNTVEATSTIGFPTAYHSVEQQEEVEKRLSDGWQILPVITDNGAIKMRNPGKRTSHLFHLVMTVLTLGLWILVWGWSSFANDADTITVGPNGEGESSKIKLIGITFGVVTLLVLASINPILGVLGVLAGFGIGLFALYVHKNGEPGQSWDEKLASIKQRQEVTLAEQKTARSKETTQAARADAQAYYAARSAQNTP